MEEMGTSGVESASIGSTPVAAEQGSQVETTAVPEDTGTPTTGESTPAAGESTGTEDKTEIAFAKRLAKERERIESEAFAKAQAQIMSNDPTMKFVSKIAEENGMTPQELVQYWEQEQQRQEREQFLAQGIPEHLAEKLQKLPELESKVQGWEKSQALTRRVQAERKEFFEHYPDVQIADISEEVFSLIDNRGLTLLDAYNRVHATQRIAQLEKALGVKEKNAANTGGTPGSVAGQGTVPSDFISYETFQANKSNQRWVINNLSAINKSRSKWGG
jgi:hypothetical protein